MMMTCALRPCEWAYASNSIAEITNRNRHIFIYPDEKWSAENAWISRSRAINASHSTKGKKRENKNENEKKYVLKHKNAQFKLKAIN